MGKNSEPDKPPTTFPLTEDDPMPFGKYRGKPLCCVPATYLIWFLDQEWAQNNWPALYDYCNENFEELVDKEVEESEEYLHD